MATVFTTLSYASASMIISQPINPQFSIRAEKNKASGKFCLFATFNIESGNVADFLERCLENCRCKSFHICQNTKCQLCSSHKEENSSLLHDKDGCMYATYEMRDMTETIPVRDDQSSLIAARKAAEIVFKLFCILCLLLTFNII